MSIAKTRRFGLVEAIFVLLFTAIAFFSYLVVFAAEESASQPVAEVSIDPQPSLLASIGIWLLAAGVIVVAVVVILKLRARANQAKSQSHPLVNAGIPPASGTRQPETVPPAPAPAPAPMPLAQPAAPPPPAQSPPAPPSQPTPSQAEAHSLLENMPQVHKPGEVFHPESNQTPPTL